MSVRIFPNPTSDYLYLESPSLPISRLKVYDLNGNEMRVPTAGVGTRQTLDLRKMNRGIYLVRLWTERGMKGYKILVE